MNSSLTPSLLAPRPLILVILLLPTVIIPAPQLGRTLQKLQQHLSSRNIWLVGKLALSRLSSMLPASRCKETSGKLESFLFVISTFVSPKVEIKPSTEIHLLGAKTVSPVRIPRPIYIYPKNPKRPNRTRLIFTRLV